METELWKRLASSLNIAVVAPFAFESEGRRVEFTALLPQFGAPNGMVVDADWSLIEPRVNALLAAGYGFSCVSLGNEAHDDDLEASVEMLRDWGWNSHDAKPAWL